MSRRAECGDPQSLVDVEAAPSQVYSARRRFPSSRLGLVSVKMDAGRADVALCIDTGATSVVGEAGAHPANRKRVAKIEK